MKVIIFALLISLIACSKDSASTPATSQSADPFVGNWVRTYVVSGKPPRFEGLSIRANGEIEFRMEVATSADTRSEGLGVLIFKGTYVKIGNQYRIVYTHETCSPINYETVNIFSQSDKLIIERENSSTVYEKGHNPILLDKKEVETCSGLSRLTSPKRAIASEKK